MQRSASDDAVECSEIDSFIGYLPLNKGFIHTQVLLHNNDDYK